MNTTKSEPKAYKGHNPGSRKGRVHEAFDRKGSDVAWTLGKRLGLAEGTLRSWLGQWERDKGKSKPAAKKPTPKKKKAEADNANVEVAAS